MLRTVDPVTFFAIAWLLLSVIFLIHWLRARSAESHAKKRISEAETTAAVLKEKYSPIASIEDEISTLRSAAIEIQKKIEQTRTSYSEKRATLKKLEH